MAAIACTALIICNLKLIIQLWETSYKKCESYSLWLFAVWDEWPATRICGSGRRGAVTDGHRHPRRAAECHGRRRWDHRAQCYHLCDKVPRWKPPIIGHNRKQHSHGSRGHEHDLNASKGNLGTFNEYTQKHTTQRWWTKAEVLSHRFRISMRS